MDSPAVQQFDGAVDQWWERLRGNPIADRIFFAATNAGEFSVIWHAAGVAHVLAGRWTWRDTARFSAVMGIESLIVNQGIKRMFGRVRPATAADNTSDRHLRQPITSSFPSGHASAAFCAAAVLAVSSPAPRVLRLLATVVATSRIHVRLHHASDVIGGALAGAAIGRVAVRLARLSR